MSNTKKSYLFVLLAFVLLLASCSGGGGEEGSDPTPTPTPETDERYDAQTVSASVSGGTSSVAFVGADTVLTLVLRRSTSSGDLKMNVSVTARHQSAICKIDKQQVVFASGVSEATIQLPVKGMEMETTDTLDVKRVYVATDKGSAKTGTEESLMAIPLQREFSYIWEDYGIGTFSSTGWSTADVLPVTWNVSIQKVQKRDMFKVLNCYETGTDVIFVCNGDSVTVEYQPGWSYSARYGIAYIYGSGTRSGNKLTTDMTYYLPSINYTFGTYREILTLPEK